MIKENFASTGKPFDIYVIYTGGDDLHSGSPNGNYAYLDEAAAKQKAKGMGWWGGNAHVDKFLAIKDNDGCYWLISKEIKDINETQFNYEKEIKEQALEKLSAEERRILGI